MVYLIQARKLDPSCVKRDAKLILASDLLEQINGNCYTEYKAFGPSLIYNNIIKVHNRAQLNFSCPKFVLAEVWGKSLKNYLAANY